MSNILKANNSDTSYLHSPKNIQDSISLKNIPPQLQPAVPSSSSSTEEKTMAMTNPIPSTLPTEAEAAVLITHLSASMECNAAAADTQVQDATNATPDPSIVWRTSEEPETRLRSKSRSTPPSGNGSEQEQEGSSVAYKRVKRPNPFARLSTQPRWHNQSYMLFLALRQHPERSLPRTELIKAALAMDKKISDELNLPKVFRGKTPMNSASAILTNNSDRYFIPYKPLGSRSTHFKLAYEPCNFQHAVEEYRIWEKKLVEHDWPYCFGVPKPDTQPKSTVIEDNQQESKEYMNGIKDLETSSTSGVKTADLETFLSATAILNGDTSVKRDAPISGIRDTDIEVERRRSSDASDHSSHKRNATATSNGTHNEEINGSPPAKKPKVELTEFDRFITRRKLSSSESPTSALAASKIEPEVESPPPLVLSPVIPKIEPASPPRPSGQLKSNSNVSSLPAASEGKDTGINTTLPSEDPSHVDLNDLDLSNIPKCWQDIVEVKPSTIPNSGNGLFAARDLPYNTPLGFYFGVPMSEDEFDSLKDNVGVASQYSIMYRKTVLDATDANGMPYTDPDSEMYCPFHFMNENEEKNSNITFLEGALVNQVICWTKRNIEKGEELFVWYGRDVDRHWEDGSTSDTKRTAVKRREQS